MNMRVAAFTESEKSLNTLSKLLVCLSSSLTCTGSAEPSLIADAISTNISFVVQYVSENVLFVVEISYATTLQLDQDYTPALDNPDSPTYKSLKEEIESEVCVRLMACLNLPRKRF